MKKSFSVLVGTTTILLMLTASAIAIAKEVRPGIAILHGIGAGLPNDDLKPLQRVIGDAPVVGLGEVIHGSGGFSRLKYRIFRYLVEEMDFRAFAFESPWDPADRVAEYVRTCEGTPEEAMEGLFSVWQNESVRDLVQWMCGWNRRHPDDPVYFYGFDMQQPEYDAPALRAYLERVGLAGDDPRMQWIRHCSQSMYGNYYAEHDYTECVKRLDQLSRFFDRREARLVRDTSREEFEVARIRLVGYRALQDQRYYLNTDPEDLYPVFVARDGAMAWILLALRDLRFPGVKTAVWAHNVHISKNGIEAYGVPTMGTYLDEVLGDDYVILGLTGYDVHIDRSGVGCGGIEPYFPGDSVEQLLHDLGQPWLFVDLDFRGSSKRFLGPGREYQVWRVPLVPRDHYDGFFFLDYSRPMVPVNRRPCE